jgi:tetratricopeptide (TPR) repeat protein
MKFQENLSIILDELQMAKQWGKASIIFTTHKSTFSQDKTKKALRKSLENLDWVIVELEINKIKGNFIDYMLQYQNLENIVFYISNINWGEGVDKKDGYRILNLYRETFVEQNIKAIFFLTLKEALTLPINAPDFWAFRHRVLEFSTPHSPGSQKPPAGIMLWQLDGSINPIADIENKVSNLTKMLREIPDRAESVSLRIDLHYELGFLHWQNGDPLSAEKKLKNGVNLANAYSLTKLLTKLSIGLAIIDYEQEHYQQALNHLEPLLREYPHDCLLILNQAIVLFVKNKRYMAIRRGQKATSICSQNPWMWNSLGFLNYFAGKMDEALNCFQKATDIAPKSGYFFESLAICYWAIGLQDKAVAQLNKAKNLSSQRKIFQDVLKEHIEDNAEKALFLMEKAINSGELTKVSLLRDPILGTLIGSSKIT